MTTSTNNSPSFVTTPNGSRIPKVGSICCHPSIGFAEVVGRSGSRVRIAITDFSEATDVVLNAGTSEETTISREAWLSRVSDASLNSACAEIAVLEARALEENDGLFGARVLVKSLSASIEARVRDVNEMLVNIDGAEAIGWEFDEFATFTPKKETKRAKAPAPRPFKKPASNVGTLEDPTKPDWLVAEMNECFGDMWTPASAEPTEQAPRS
jgi:hypothetical protein